MLVLPPFMLALWRILAYVATVLDVHANIIPSLHIERRHGKYASDYGDAAGNYGSGYSSEYGDTADIDGGGAARIVEDEAATRIVSKLHAILDPFLLRRLKSDVVLELPTKQVRAPPHGGSFLLMLSLTALRI